MVPGILGGPYLLLPRSSSPSSLPPLLYSGSFLSQYFLLSSTYALVLLGYPQAVLSLAGGSGI